MLVDLFMKTKEQTNTCYKITKKKITMKEARIYAEHLKANEDVVAVWGIWFDGWHRHKKHIWDRRQNETSD